uniref:CSON009262 protein n=1 Tax=Culicoides sonorensis TaxID=179676 RepID=A0A336N2V1_CULSO
MFPRLPIQNGGIQADTDTVNQQIIPESMDYTDTDSSTVAYNLVGEPSDWWVNAIEEDDFFSPMPFDASEGGLWNGRFVPPPPRPPFLENTVLSDGLTTCDLCSWAWHDKNSFSSLGESSGKLQLDLKKNLCVYIKD